MLYLLRYSFIEHALDTYNKARCEYVIISEWVTDLTMRSKDFYVLKRTN